MEQIIGIFDEQTGYAGRLAGYVNERHDLGCLAVAFSKEEEIAAYCKEKYLSHLLYGGRNISRSQLDLVRGFLPESTELVILTEDRETLRSAAECSCVFKYQQAEELLRKVLKPAETCQTEVNGFYTVFAPADNRAAERAAWELAVRLSADGKTLFLPWEPFCAFGRDTTTGRFPAQRGKSARDTVPVQEIRNLSELLYLLRKGDAAEQVFAGLPAENGVEYVAAADYCTDLWQYSPKEMVQLLQCCRDSGKYQNIVFFAGFFTESIEAVMCRSDAVYLISLSDEAGMRRQEEFFRQMKYAGKQELLSKIHEIREGTDIAIGKEERNERDGGTEKTAKGGGAAVF